MTANGDGLNFDFLDEPEPPQKPPEPPVPSPEKIPSLSDGRTEKKDFTEEFGAEASDLAGDHTAPPVDALFSESSFPPELLKTPESFSDLVEPIDSLIDQAPAAPDVVEACADTVVGDSPFRDQPLLDGEPQSAPERDDTPVTSESGEMSLDGLNDTGMSLSSMAGAAAASTTPKAIIAPVSGNQRVMLIAIGGYAIAVTALCVLLLGMLTKARNAGQLESLPDLKPIPPGKVAIYPVHSLMPAGHTLALGESQRFGNLRVEPIKVTRGPIQFQYYKPDSDQKGYASEPVLKLWLKFTNESSAQAFVPLDGDLMFKRRVDANDAVRANNFLVQVQDKPRSFPLVFLYDHHPESSNFDIAGQRLGQQLQPGESLETYLPTTEEGIDRLKGDLLWRVQLRKGHSPEGNGVTTLVEVAFSQDQIQSEGI